MNVPIPISVGHTAEKNGVKIEWRESKVFSGSKPWGPVWLWLAFLEWESAGIEEYAHLIRVLADDFTAQTAIVVEYMLSDPNPPLGFSERLICKAAKVWLEKYVEGCVATSRVEERESQNKG